MVITIYNKLIFLIHFKAKLSSIEEEQISPFGIKVVTCNEVVPCEKSSNADIQREIDGRCCDLYNPSDVCRNFVLNQFGECLNPVDGNLGNEYN